MSTVEWIRGIYRVAVRAVCGAAAVSLLSISAAMGAGAAAPSAELSTYQRADGQTFYALSLTPEAAAPKPGEAHDVVILFDTSASQAGNSRAISTR